MKKKQIVHIMLYINMHTLYTVYIKYIHIKCHN